MEETIKQRLERLFHSDSWSKEDRIWLEDYLNNTDSSELRLIALKDLNADIDDSKTVLDQKLSAHILRNIHDRITIKEITHRKSSLARGIAIAASVLVILSAGIFYYFRQTENTGRVIRSLSASNIVPGSNKAVLTLSDGRKISLTDAADGKLAEQSGIKIVKQADGKVTYTISDQLLQNSGTEYNTIETPVGGQYQVNLPDGSTVWLNAASSLKYPVSFKPQNRRNVYLKGEAYFEVAKDKLRPFIVHTSKQEVEVLGTHFNISAYTDESEIKTTLLEGLVKVSGGKYARVLRPGQQSVLRGNTFSVSEVDAEEMVAWKNGYFVFENAGIQTIMKNLSRWYDVDIEYQGSVTDQKFGGALPRSIDIDELLRYLETYGNVHFKIAGRRIIVMQ